MLFETPPFVPCHSPNNSIFVLLPNAQFFGESLTNPKISVDTVDKQKSCLSADITKNHLTIYINLKHQLVMCFQSKPDLLAMLPSQELTYPFSNSLLKMIFLFPRWGVLVPRWGVLVPFSMMDCHVFCSVSPCQVTQGGESCGGNFTALMPFKTCRYPIIGKRHGSHSQTDQKQVNRMYTYI